MKVVLFCGGMGTRMRDFAPTTPKPLVHIGERPLLWYIMNYYAHHGHREFVLCLGYGVEAFLTYFRQSGAVPMPTVAGDAVGHTFRLVDEWGDVLTVSLVDTGPLTSIGQRLKAVQRYVAGEPVFLANYADGLSDAPLPDIVRVLEGRADTVGVMIAVRPTQSFHYLHQDHDGVVTGIEAGTGIDVRINGGFFAFRAEIFDYLGDDDDLVEGAFDRLIGERRLLAFPYDGFWRACDTFKDVMALEAARLPEPAPWEVWRGEATADRREAVG